MKSQKIIMIIVFTLCSTIQFAQTKTYYVATNGSGTAPYDTWTKAAGSIQTVISAASDGDIIIVGSSDGHGSGRYTENIVVNKQLTIQSENGNSTTTIAAANPQIHVVEITADNVTIKGLSLYGGTDMWVDQSTGELYFPVGIFLNNVNNCTIESNRCGWDSSHQNTNGISLFASGKCVISGNITSYNRGGGISIDSSYENTVTSNVVVGNDADGFGLGTSTDNTISGNTVSNNGLDGFIIGTSDNNTFENNTALGNGFHGFQLFSSSGNTLNGNQADSNTIHGIYLDMSSDNNLENNTACCNKGVGIGLDMSTYNRVTGSTVKHNEYGVFIGGGSHNTINSNVMNDNDGRPDGDGIMLTGSSYNTLMNNTMNNDPGDGIEFYESSNNNVIGNTVINSGWGIRINKSSSNNVLSGNIVNDGVKGIILEEANSVNNVLANNTTNNNSEDGIFLYDFTSDNILIGNTAKDNVAHGIHINGDSQGNTMYLNNLIDNKENSIYIDEPNNTWHSPTEIYYDYNSGTVLKGYLGNYYSDGNHTGSNGIGGTYYLNNVDTDNYQLIDTSGSFTLQVWWLNDNGNMYIGDAGKAGGRAALNSSEPYIWKSAQLAMGNITYFGSEPWTGDLLFSSVPAAGHTFLIEIGSVSGGNNFTPGGPDAVLTGDGSSKKFTFATDTSTFTVPVGNYLALRIKSSGTDDSLMTGGAWSFISGPESEIDSILPPPVMPELLWPESNAINLPTIVDLFCSRTLRAVQYHWQAATDKNFSSFAVDDSTSDSTITVGPLSAGEKYYWRVRSIGLTGNSDFTGPDSFTVLSVPLPPELISPVSTTEEKLLPVFIWHQSEFALEYHIQVSGDSLFSPLVFESMLADSTTTLSDSLDANSLYFWRVCGKNAAGEGLYSSEAHFRTLSLVGVRNDEFPGEFALYQNYPNPFNPVTIIEYQVAGNELVTLKVYDVLGREVAALVNEQKSPGKYKVRFDCSGIASGVYFYRLHAGEFVQTKRLLLVK